MVSIKYAREPMKQNAIETDETDHLFLALVKQGPTTWPIIACLYTGKLPNHCAPMPRNPTPALGQLVDGNLAAILADAIALNEAIHDGAIMIGRSQRSQPYQIDGWSHRLFPPDCDVALTENRGSAFHSSLSMSGVQGVDRVYLASKGAVLRFQDGQCFVLA